MTAEEIIQRLLDEKHITVKEALVLLKAILGIVVEDTKRKLGITDPVPDPTLPKQGKPWWDQPDVVCMYGVNITPQTVMYGVQSIPTYSKAGDYDHLEQNGAANSSFASAVTWQPNPNEVITAHGSGYDYSASNNKKKNKR